jgi:uncharacterized DUF497 family protein
VEIEFDPDKDEANRLKHGISLAEAARIDLDRAVRFEDRRFNYGETRFTAYAPIEGRLYCLWYTLRGDVVRVIGMRKANERERKRYEEGS